MNEMIKYIKEDPSIKLGSEMEVVNIKDEDVINIKEYINEKFDRDFYNYHDPTVETFLGSKVYGNELCSDILSYTKKDLIIASTALNMLKENGAKISLLCSSHIHLGRNIFCDEHGKMDFLLLYDFLILFAYFEDVIYKVSYGKLGTFRENSKQFILPIRQIVKEMLLNNNFSNVTSTLNHAYSINCSNFGDPYKDTMELKLPYGTLDEIRYIFNIIFIVTLINKHKEKAFNMEKIKHLLIRNTVDASDDLSLYAYKDNKKAKWLATTLFENQYLINYFMDSYNMQNKLVPCIIYK